LTVDKQKLNINQKHKSGYYGSVQA